jgi:hypothetical protein
MTDEPSQAELLTLHEALVAGRDPTVPARLAELLLPALRRRFRTVPVPDPHSADSLAGQSIATYLSEPERYDPERGPLLAYLWRDVAGDLKNEWKHASRRRGHETPASDTVELREPARNLSVEEEVLEALDPFDVPPALLEEARQEVARFSGTDHRLLALLTDGVRDTAAYAEVLGISHLPVALQRREVKRHKDRLKARLEVIRGRLRRPD